jgi:hypothetical protein
VLLAGLAVTTTEIEEYIDGGPLGVHPVGPAMATIEFGGEVDGRPPVGCCQWVW